MQAFTQLKGIVTLLDLPDVDTDQIIPKQFLKRIERTGFGEFLFYDWRFNEEGELNPDFEMNQERYRGASILVTRSNFGCGSSREHAPWALLDYGFRCVIAPSYSDIFYSNCLKNGILPIRLNEERVDSLFKTVRQALGYELIIDLEKKTITSQEAFVLSFDLDEFHRHCLINGLDDIGLSLQFEDKIRQYESKIPPERVIRPHSSPA